MMCKKNEVPWGEVCIMDWEMIAVLISFFAMSLGYLT
jgi:hypothetical protein